MNSRWTAVGALHLCLAIGCGSPPSSGVSITEAHSPLVKGSPLGVPDTCIYVDDVPGGADVTFTTTPPYLPRLRSRVGEQAAMNGPGSRLGTGHGAVHESSHGHGLRLWALPVRAVHQVDVDRGVRLEIIANERSNVSELRAQLRERAATLRDRECP